MKHIELKTVNQGTALATGMLALPPLGLEGLEEFKGSVDRLCLAGIAALPVVDSEVARPAATGAGARRRRTGACQLDGNRKRRTC
jgi:hypothetical protein